ncbi:hypothetical protein BpHYR1_035935 [Brachionus plicatilis]|uniref:Uncharacterized protein n=1 Tax=Brachionus plicatilis TaxID=10195 RepID=A0A3M7QSQ3_BRAPC|nr:hypothetical protein BpHYR1_035935 [Brachionus plicatilis]
MRQCDIQFQSFHLTFTEQISQGCNYLNFLDIFQSLANLIFKGSMLLLNNWDSKRCIYIFYKCTVNKRNSLKKTS